MYHRGTILGFAGSYMSGLGHLVIEDDRRGVVSVPCDNGPTVRALQAAFGDVIAPGHSVDSEGGHVGKRAYYCYDDLGLILAGFVPVDEAPSELEEAYENEEAEAL